MIQVNRLNNKLYETGLALIVRYNVYKKKIALTIFNIFKNQTWDYCTIEIYHYNAETNFSNISYFKILRMFYFLLRPNLTSLGLTLIERILID